MTADSQSFKRRARNRLRPVILTLDRMGITPLGVSIIGLAITACSGLVVGSGHLFWGGMVFLLGSAFDMLDGDLARLQGTVSAQGAFLDSCFDRLGEAFLFAGLTWFYATSQPDPAALPLVLITAVVVGSLTTSYVRARAEGVGETCFVGFLQRTERVIILTAALLLGRWILTPVLGFLAVATLATTLQRIIHVASKLPGPEPRGPRPRRPESQRPEPQGAQPQGSQSPGVSTGQGDAGFCDHGAQDPAPGNEGADDFADRSETS